MPSLPSRLCPVNRGNTCDQVQLTSYSLVVELIKVMNRLDLIGPDDVKDEARFFCHGALSTFCLSTELRQNSCHTTVLSNISLTLTFISQAEPPPPPSVWSLSLLSHYHKPVKCTCDGNASKSRSFRMLFTKYTSSKFSGWDYYNLLFRGCCQAYSPQFISPMKQRNYQSREWDLPLLVDPIAASHYQQLTLEGKRVFNTAHLDSYESYCFHVQDVLASS